MRVVVIGANGMLGHVAARTLRTRHEVFAVVRRAPTPEVAMALAGCTIVTGVDVRNPDVWRAAISKVRPEAVLNCAGIVKQRVVDPAEAIAVNALFPHQLSSLCAELGARMIHLSTDCVFSGRRGNYRESDEPDPVDLYGRSKLLGEPDSAPCLTIRTSMIGLELGGKAGLVEWFLAQRGKVGGYRRAIWSGFTTAELSRITLLLLEGAPTINGVWHVSSAAISKYDLLAMLAEELGNTAHVEPDDSVVIDRSLNSTRFREATGYKPPSHDQMLGELAEAIRAREGNRVA